MINEKLLHLIKEKNFLLKKKQHIFDNSNSFFCTVCKQDMQNIDRRLEQISLMLNPKEVIEEEIERVEGYLNKAPGKK